MHSHLPRLEPGFYTGLAMVHWTLAVENRATGWLNQGFHASWREVLLHTMARYGLACPVYCLMPDHVHLLWIGLSSPADQRSAMKFFRTHTTQLLNPHAWQRQAFDHVLREDERQRGAFTSVSQYVLENPVRQSLAADWHDWPFSGSIMAGFPSLDPRRPDFWEVFWGEYARVTAGVLR